MLYDYLRETYGENEPIFVSDIRYKDCSMNYIRQQIKRLTDSGELKRYDTGIYFIPGRSIFKSGPQLSRDKVIEQKYLKADGSRVWQRSMCMRTQCHTSCAITNRRSSVDSFEQNAMSMKIRSPSVAAVRRRQSLTGTNSMRIRNPPVNGKRTRSFCLSWHIRTAVAFLSFASSISERAMFLPYSLIATRLRSALPCLSAHSLYLGWRKSFSAKAELESRLFPAMASIIAIDAKSLESSMQMP